MPNEYPRSHRVADFIQRELADLIRTELKDPRISPMLTISSVEVTRDLGSAKIYYTCMDASEREETHPALKKAAGFLRRKLARRLNTRSVPELRFFYDDSIEKGAYMSALITKAVATNTSEDDAPEVASEAAGTNEKDTSETRSDRDPLSNDTSSSDSMSIGVNPDSPDGSAS